MILLGYSVECFSFIILPRHPQSPFKGLCVCVCVCVCIFTYIRMSVCQLRFGPFRGI